MFRPMISAGTHTMMPSRTTVREVKTDPAPMRFFHKSAMAGEPVGRSRKGSRRRWCLVPGKVPRLNAVTASARRCANASEASSKATLERMTQM